jgi:hypothetical protein
MRLLQSLDGRTTGSLAGMWACALTLECGTLADREMATCLGFGWAKGATAGRPRPEVERRVFALPRPAVRDVVGDHDHRPPHRMLGARVDDAAGYLHPGSSVEVPGHRTRERTTCAIVSALELDRVNMVLERRIEGLYIFEVSTCGHGPFFSVEPLLTVQVSLAGAVVDDRLGFLGEHPAIRLIGHVGVAHLDFPQLAEEFFFLVRAQVAVGALFLGQVRTRRGLAGTSQGKACDDNTGSGRERGTKRGLHLYTRFIIDFYESVSRSSLFRGKCTRASTAPGTGPQIKAVSLTGFTGTMKRETVARWAVLAPKETALSPWRDAGR